MGLIRGNQQTEREAWEEGDLGRSRGGGREGSGVWEDE
jgi:hypothetical protein